MERPNFDELLERYLTGQASEAEKIKIETWLDLMKIETKGGDLILESEDEERIFNKISMNIDSQPGNLVILKKDKTIFFTSWISGIAATLLFLLAIASILWLNSRIQQGTEKIILKDGTLVWLKGKSTLHYYEDASTNSRHAELHGEALFEVAKDSHRPFFVTCGDMTIRVLGTSFNLKLVSDSLVLEVLTGHVNVSSKRDSIGVNIEPRQKVVYHLYEEVKKTRITAAEIFELTDNTEYNMKFVNASLETVIPKIEKKFNVKMEIDKSLFNRCKVTADFTDRSLESTLQMISEVLEFEYKRTGNSVFVTGDGCK